MHQDLPKVVFVMEKRFKALPPHIVYGMNLKGSDESLGTVAPALFSAGEKKVKTKIGSPDQEVH